MAATSSAWRARSFNGLANAQRIAAIHGGRHTAPSFGGDTLYAGSQVARETLPGRSDFGALRVRTIATKDRACHNFPDKDAAGATGLAVVLEQGDTVLRPRR